jgi:hypothetical protein
MANLYVTITEEITLPNNNKEKTSNIVTIQDVNQIVRRIDTIATTFSGSGIEIIRLCDSEEEQTGGAFVKSDVKYIRITNLSQQHDTAIYLIANNSTENALFNLNPGKTLMLGDADINTPSFGDYLETGYVDETYYSTFTYINSIKAKAISGSIQLEYFVASL